jgi:hypothetical protein
MAYLICLTHVNCVSLNYVVEYSAFLFVNLEVLGFVVTADTGSRTKDFHCFIHFSQETTQQ